MPTTTNDPRFSTTGALSRTVVEQWMKKRDMKVLNEWFIQGEPHKRLADEALAFAVREGWVDGAQRVWDAAWSPRATMMSTLWDNLARLTLCRNGPGQVPPIQAWAEALTWEPTGDKDHAKAQKVGQVNALSATIQSRRLDLWGHYIARGVSLSSGAGAKLLDDLLYRRYALYGNTIPEPDAVPRLEAMLDDVLALPDAARAALNPDHLVRLLWRTRTQQDGCDTAWQRLDQLMAQTRPGFPVKDRAIMLCEMALVGRAIAAPAARMQRLLDRTIAWGVPATVVFTPEDMAYGSRYENYWRVEHGQVFVRGLDGGQYHAPDLRGHYTDRITLDNPEMHVGDHWFYGNLIRDQWGRTNEEPLTDDQKAGHRARFSALVEAPQLRRAMDKVTAGKPLAVKPTRRL